MQQNIRLLYTFILLVKICYKAKYDLGQVHFIEIKMFSQSNLCFCGAEQHQHIYICALRVCLEASDWLLSESEFAVIFRESLQMSLLKGHCHELMKNKSVLSIPEDPRGVPRHPTTTAIIQGVSQYFGHSNIQFLRIKNLGIFGKA